MKATMPCGCAALIWCLVKSSTINACGAATQGVLHVCCCCDHSEGRTHLLLGRLPLLGGALTGKRERDVEGGGGPTCSRPAVTCQPHADTIRGSQVLVDGD